jgi:uncharacterized protein YbjT (DUF2867 family)
MKILVTGVTGYIGSRLTLLLTNQGEDVRVAARDVSRLDAQSWRNEVDVVEADLNAETLPKAMFDGVDVAYYLVHSMGAGPDFHERDRAMARRFAEAARHAGTSRIIYLGALGSKSSGLTEHLRSRQETGVLLASTGVNVVELRAGPVVGAGSLPFEMIRYLTERVPIMVCPRWVYTKVQPIGLSEVLAYLLASKEVQATGHEVVEIGGAQVVSYGEMMTTYARVRGLIRLMVRVPVLTPRLSSIWVHLITPLRGSFARPLVEGLRNEVVVRDRRALQMFPEVLPTGYENSVTLALEDLRPDRLPRVPSTQAFSSNVNTQTTNLQGMIRDCRTLAVSTDPATVFEVFSSLGGGQGWYIDWGWKLRGAIDRLLGGPGLRRHRPDDILSVGDKVAFWRVEAVDPGSRLLLRAEMKLPGEAWLEFMAAPNEQGGTSLTQTSYFAPKGLGGVAYWFALLPIHKVVFNGLIRRVAWMATSGS